MQQWTRDHNSQGEAMIKNLEEKEMTDIFEAQISNARKKDQKRNPTQIIPAKSIKINL